MYKIISLFNNKGGVSKTTTTFNLGWKLAQMGHKTLIVDTDPQCNLTGLCLNSENVTDYKKIYSEYGDIKKALAPVLDGDQGSIEAAECYPITSNENLLLLPGNIGFSEYDATYNIAQNLTGSLSIFKNVPGAFSELLKKTAEKYSLEYILIDMSPSISATNANLLMSSNYFILPCAPDYFCYMAIQSLCKVFDRWVTDYKSIRNNNIFSTATYKLPDALPKFLGTIQQRYRPRNGSPAKAFLEWIDKIGSAVRTDLVPTLEKLNMVNQKHNADYNLSNIADFNSLIAMSQEHSTPVFLLNETLINRHGQVLENMLASVDNFDKAFEALAQTIIELTK